MTGTRDRILNAGGEFFGRQGYAGTGVKQIVEAAQAPFASLYHFFPGGKEQLGAEVIRRSGALYQQLIGAVFDPAPDVVSAVESFFVGAAETLRQTGFADACPIATIALEVASSSEPLRQATAEVFESWIAAAAQRFSEAGIGSGKSRELAIYMIAALEGAFVLSRAARNTEALTIAGAMAASAVRAALPERRRNGGRAHRARTGGRSRA